MKIPFIIVLIAVIAGQSIHTLAKWRCNRKGPEYMRTGRLVKHNRKAIEAYLEKHDDYTSLGLQQPSSDGEWGREG